MRWWYLDGDTGQVTPIPGTHSSYEAIYEWLYDNKRRSIWIIDEATAAVWRDALAKVED